MRVRLALVTLTSAASLLCSLPAQAQCKYDLLQSLYQDFRRNNCWPEPFVGPDRMSVRAPFETMIHNGWLQQNLLSEHHFNDADGRLNEAGRLKVQWILTEAPPQHRTIYVRRAGSTEATAARIAAVQEIAGQQLAGSVQPPEVVESTISPVGWPASRVDAIDRAFQSSIPPPRLPKPQAENRG